MTRLILPLILLLSHLANGQSADSVKRIVFQFGESHNDWKTPGIYSRQEIITYTRTDNHTFSLSSCYRITQKLSSDSITRYTDSLKLHNRKHIILPAATVKNLLTELSTDRQNFTTAYLQPQLAPPVPREVRRLAVKYGHGYKFTDKDWDKADHDTIYNRMFRFYRFDKFLKMKQPKKGMVTVVLDAYRGYRITFQTEKDTIRYDGSFFQPLAQPVARYRNHDFEHPTQVVNLNINTMVAQLLPDQSLFKQYLSFNSIIPFYVEWYFKEN